MPGRVDARMLFDALCIEGSILPPEWLARVAALEAPLQEPSNYAVPKGLELRDEIARYWRMARALYADFASQLTPATDQGARAAARFTHSFLVDAFGFAGLAKGGQRELQGRMFGITYEWSDGRVPIVVGAPGETLDALSVRHGDGSRRRSAWGLLQAYLNANDACLWGIASNGVRLRIGRDNTSLTRPAWIEADLERIFEEDRFADFSVLWLVLHASRFAGDPKECALERWREEAHQAGTRARDQLRDGVEAALLALGQGFLEAPANTALRDALSSGELTPGGYFNELLRLVYRMIFLLTVEERGLLHADDVPPDTRAIYAEGYSLRRLVDRSVRRSQYDRHHDKWAALRPVFAALGRPGGEPRLGLPELGGLFSSGQCPHLDTAELANRALLEAVFRLGWLRQETGLSRVNWKDMGPEELGSIYESLLELVPRIGQDGRSFDFGGGSAGNERKLTGSYYTPDSLVQKLLDTALEPVIEARLAAADDPERALLSIAVVDAACGSGHFLLAAARRLASRLAAIRSGGTPGAHEYRIALRDVVMHCIHGVDRNPLALELARMSLWLETYTPDRALGFLDHHLIQGDALLGLLDLNALKYGIPDDAFDALTGDDTTVAQKLKRLNREGRRQLERRLHGRELELALRQEGLGDAFARLDQLDDTRLETVEAKRQTYAQLRAEAAESAVALAADLYMAAFLMPKRLAAGQEALTGTAALDRCPTTGTLLMALDGALPANHTAAMTARAVCRAASVLHWPLAFPHVFARGGFDVVLGNPPWERIKVQEQEFFASRDPAIAGARNRAERQRLLRQLELAPEGSPQRRLFEDYINAKRLAEAASAFYHAKARYPLTGVGDVNTYALFAETAFRLVAPTGRAGLVLPTGIATDDSTKRFFSDLIQLKRLASLYDFENRQGLFPAVHRQQKFCLFTIGQAEAAEFAFFLLRVHELSDERRRFELTPEDLKLLNPNTLTCPNFRSRADAELTKKIYRHIPVLIDEAKPPQEGNLWGLSFMRMFDMANDSHLFRDQLFENGLPLYEAKMIHQFDHRWATYERNPDGSVSSRQVTDTEKGDPSFEVRPRYWVDRTEVVRRSADVPSPVLSLLGSADDKEIGKALAEWVAGYFLNRGGQLRWELMRWLPTTEQIELSDINRERARATEREFPLSEDEIAFVQGCHSPSDVLERLVQRRTPRWFLGWRDITNATNERTVIASVIPFSAVGHTLPIMRCRVHGQGMALLLGNLCAIVFDYVARQKVGGTHLTYAYLKQLPVLPPSYYSQEDIKFIVPRVAELTNISNRMSSWDDELTSASQPYAWNSEQRAQLRAELDAYYAGLYGLTREELSQILDPSEVLGPDYPSETFRVLRRNEERQFGEYRTKRLILEAWDRLDTMKPGRTRSPVSA